MFDFQVLKNSGVGDAFNNIGKQLKDGHWVLAFPSVEAANYATLLVDQHAAKLRAYYCEVYSLCQSISPVRMFAFEFPFLGRGRQPRHAAGGPARLKAARLLLQGDLPFEASAYRAAVRSPAPHLWTGVL